jgi:hypothetical protein
MGPPGGPRSVPSRKGVPGGNLAFIETIRSSEIEQRDETPAFPDEEECEPAGACSNPANPRCCSGRMAEEQDGPPTRHVCVGIAVAARPLTP